MCIYQFQGNIQRCLRHLAEKKRNRSAEHRAVATVYITRTRCGHMSNLTPKPRGRQQRKLSAGSTSLGRQRQSSDIWQSHFISFLWQKEEPRGASFFFSETSWTSKNLTFRRAFKITFSYFLHPFLHLNVNAKALFALEGRAGHDRGRGLRAKRISDSARGPRPCVFSADLSPLRCVASSKPTAKTSLERPKTPPKTQDVDCFSGVRGESLEPWGSKNRRRLPASTTTALPLPTECAGHRVANDTLAGAATRG